MKALLILGNQLFDPAFLLKKSKLDTKVLVYMREDFELCTYYKFHQQKIVFFLAAMRAYAQELTDSGFTVHYEKLNESKNSYEKHFESFLQKNSVKEVLHFEIEDKFFENRIKTLAKELNISFQSLQSPMFLTSRSRFKDYLGKTKKPFMKTFYESQRKDFNVLVDANKKPLGGQWSFDDQNRLPLPKDIHPPTMKPTHPSKFTLEVIKLVHEKFSDHPGDSSEFWLPTHRNEAGKWFDQFLEEKLSSFGPYEDAINPRSDFVFHSILTPFLNTGLITPEQIVKKTLIYAQKKKIALSSVEGFLRQIIGWREFIRGIYQNYSEKQETTNYWDHKGQLSSHWYQGNTGIPPLDNAIKKTLKYGYCHHIERLMVVGSLMLLLEIEPRSAHAWFMEMFIDSSDWVMGPNVYGMALFSDGGIFATKPYICGSNYYRKMGGYKKEDWCDGVDGLYWQFIEKHQKFFLKNPRLSMIARTVEKMDSDKKKLIYSAAEKLRKRLVLDTKVSEKNGFH